MKLKTLYTLSCVLGVVVLVYLGLWAIVTWHGGIARHAVTGTPNEDAQAMARTIAFSIRAHAGNCDYISTLKKLGYPKVVTGKGGRKYLANVIVRFDKEEDLRIHVEVTGDNEEKGEVGFGLNPCNFTGKKK